MQYLIPAIIGALGTAIGSLVGRVLLALSISYVTFKGMTVATDQIEALMRAYFGSIGGEVGSLIGFLWIDKALSMVVSAFAAAFAIKTTSGVVTKMVVKK